MKPGREPWEGEPAAAQDEVTELWRLEGGSPGGWKYRVYARSISRSLGEIDRYVAEHEGNGELPALAFSEDCVFLANREMDKVRYDQVTFDTFAELTEDALICMNPPPEFPSKGFDLH